MPTGFDDRNVIPIFLDRYETLLAGSWAMDLSLFNANADSASETYGIFGGFPKMREWIGARQAQTIAQRSYTIRNRPFESTLVVPQRLLDRDKTGLLKAYIGDYTQAVPVNRWEDMLIDLINTNGMGYDGQSFFSTTHQFAFEGSQSNQVSSTDVPALDVAIPAAPTPAELYAAVVGMIAYMMMFKDDKGRYVNQTAKKFYVVVSTPALYTAFSLPLNVQNPAYTPVTQLKSAGFTVEPIFLPALTGATAKIRIFRADGQLKPFITQQEQDIEFSLLGSQSDFYFENKAIKLGIDDSRGAGYGLYEYALEGTLS